MLYFIRNTFSFSLLTFFLFTLISCSPNSGYVDKINLNGTFQDVGFQNFETNKIAIRNNSLYVGTTSGLYKKNQMTDSSNWSQLFQEKGILDFIIWNDKELLIGTATTSSKEASIFITRDGGDSWQPYQNGFGTEDKNNQMFVVQKNPVHPETLYARGDFNVVMSVDSGKNWNNLVGSWDGFGDGRFLTIDSSDPDIVWAGGTTAIFTPHLIKSSDGGDSWQNLSIYDGEATVYDLIINSNNSDHALAGLSIGIYRSSNKGETWSIAYGQGNISTLSHSTRNPKVTYASGIKQQGTLFFAASPDFGDTWQTVEFTDGPTGIQVNDMVSVMVDGREVLYFGTNKGVYSYEFEE